MKNFKDNLKTMPSGCIEWTGHTIKSNGRDSHRYGRLKVNGKDVLAHRHAYELANGPIPVGLMVLHRCDNTRCCNPEHLFLGTHAENMADMAVKGRASRSANIRPARGERSGASKLTEVVVREIRQRRAAGEKTTALAAQFNVHNSVISRVVNRKTWTHI